MTLLEKMAEAAMPALTADYPNDRVRAHKVLRAALEVISAPTLAMVNRGALQAFAGPQVEGEPLRLYPALIWREMLNYVVEERDRERDDDGDDAAGAEDGDGA